MFFTLFIKGPTTAEGAYPRGKLKKFSNVLMLDEIKEIEEDCSLLSPVDCSLTILDSYMLTTFVER